jgi:hypothetical protein
LAKAGGMAEPRPLASPPSAATRAANCSEPYCVSCPTSRRVCTKCRGDAPYPGMQPLGVFAGRDGR